MSRPRIDDPRFWQTPAPVVPQTDHAMDPVPENDDTSVAGPPKREMEPLVTRAEVAETFSVTLATVSNWHRWGWLPAVQVGRRLLFRRSDLEEVIDRRDSNKKGDTKQNRRFG